MDVSRKLYKEDIIIISEFQTELLKKDSRMTQKTLIDKAIKFALENKNRFMDYLTGKKTNNTKAMTEKFLSLPKADLGENWMEEIDTIEHEDMLKRNKKVRKHDK